MGNRIAVTTRTLALLLRIAVRNVRRGWRHSLAAILTMAVGFVAIATFDGYLFDLLDTQKQVSLQRNMIGELMVRKVGGGGTDARIWPRRYWMGPREQAVVDAWLARHRGALLTSVRSVIVSGIASAGGPSAAFLAIGYDVAEGEVARKDWKWLAWAGRNLRPDDSNGIMLGLGLGRLLGCEPASQEPVFDPHTALLKPVERPMRCKTTTLQLSASSVGGRVNALDGEVIGLSSGSVREFDLQMVWAPLPFIQNLAETRDIALYNVLLRDPDQAAALRSDLMSAISAAKLDLEVVEWEQSEFGELFRRGKELLGAYRNLVILVLLVIAGSAVLTTMAKTVRERTREIGTLRSLGFGRLDMLALFALEAALLAIVGGAIGTCVALALRSAVNAAHISYSAGLLAEDMLLTIGLSARTYAAGFSFLTLVAVVASWLAARRVVAMRVADALTTS